MPRALHARDDRSLRRSAHYYAQRRGMHPVDTSPAGSSFARESSVSSRPAPYRTILSDPITLRSIQPIQPTQHHNLSRSVPSPRSTPTPTPTPHYTAPHHLAPHDTTQSSPIASHPFLSNPVSPYRIPLYGIPSYVQSLPYLSHPTPSRLSLSHHQVSNPFACTTPCRLRVCSFI